MADVWHTVFGIAGASLLSSASVSSIADKLISVHTGLSLLGYEGLAKVDPVYCMPAAVIARVLDSS